MSLNMVSGGYTRHSQWHGSSRQQSLRTSSLRDHESEASSWSGAAAWTMDMDTNMVSSLQQQRRPWRSFSKSPNPENEPFCISDILSLPRARAVMRLGSPFWGSKLLHHFVGPTQQWHVPRSATAVFPHLSPQCL